MVVAKGKKCCSQCIVSYRVILVLVVACLQQFAMGFTKNETAPLLFALPVWIDGKNASNYQFGGGNDAPFFEKECKLDQFFSNCMAIPLALKDTPLDLWNLIILTFTLGGLLGCFLGFQLSMHLGRKLTILVSSIFLCVGTAFKLISTDFLPFAVGRFLTGIAAGIASHGFAFLSEVSPGNLRKVFFALVWVSGAIGVTSASVVGLFTLDGQLWRILVAIPVIPVIIATPLLLCVPASPRWLLVRKAEGRAFVALKQYRRADCDVREEFAGLVARQAKKGEKLPLTSVFKRASVVFLLQAIHMMSGESLIANYQTRIFNDFPLLLRADYLGTVCNLAKVVGCILSVFITSESRAVLIVGTIVQCASLTSVVLCMVCEEMWPGYSAAMGMVGIVAISLFIIFNAISIGPAIGSVLQEMFNTSHLRAFFNWLSASWTWFNNAVGIFFFPTWMGFAGDLSFLPFCCSLLIGLFYLSTFYNPSSVLVESTSLQNATAYFPIKIEDDSSSSAEENTIRQSTGPIIQGDSVDIA